MTRLTQSMSHNNNCNQVFKEQTIKCFPKSSKVNERNPICQTNGTSNNSCHKSSVLLNASSSHFFMVDYLPRSSDQSYLIFLRLNVQEFMSKQIFTTVVAFPGLHFKFIKYSKIWFELIVLRRFSFHNFGSSFGCVWNFRFLDYPIAQIRASWQTFVTSNHISWIKRIQS